MTTCCWPARRASSARRCGSGWRPRATRSSGSSAASRPRSAEFRWDPTPRRARPGRLRRRRRGGQPRAGPASPTGRGRRRGARRSCPPGSRRPRPWPRAWPPAARTPRCSSRPAASPGTAAGAPRPRTPRATRPRPDFFAQVCARWEAAAQPAVDAGVRVVFLRTSPVLDRSGGPFLPMRLAWSAGLGAVLGDGTQRMPMISLRRLPRRGGLGGGDPARRRAVQPDHPGARAPTPSSPTRWRARSTGRGCSRRRPWSCAPRWASCRAAAGRHVGAAAAPAGRRLRVRGARRREHRRHRTARRPRGRLNP